MLPLDDIGVTIEGTDNLIDHATSYYKNLFGPARGYLSNRSFYVRKWMMVIMRSLEALQSGRSKRCPVFYEKKQSVLSKMTL
jgi:hypothetical protein